MSLIVAVSAGFFGSGGLLYTCEEGRHMPLKLLIGSNRKTGLANYSSAGASLNLELEVDSALLGRPEELQEKIDEIQGCECEC